MKMKKVMKKVSLVMLLATPVLLSSCTTRIVRVNEPRFARMGNELQFSDFYSQLMDRMNKNDLNAEEYFGDKVLNVSTSSKLTDTLVRNSSTITKSVEGQKINGTIKYDCDKLAVSSKYNTFSVTDKKTETGNENFYQDEDEESLSFVTTYNDQTVCINAKPYELTANIEKTFTEEDNKKEYVQGSYKLAALLSTFLAFSSQLPAEDAEESVLADYKFYRNGNYFTYVLNKTQNVHLDDSELGIYANGELNVYFKGQIEITNNKIATKSYYKKSVEYTFNFDYQNNREADVTKTVGEQAVDISSVSKAVRIKTPDLRMYTIVE